MSTSKPLHSIFFLILANVGIFFCQTLHGAPHSVTLKIDNKQVDTVGKNSCDSTKDVEIVLPNSITDIYEDFRFVRKKVATSDAKSPCPQTIADNSSTSTFTKDNPKFEEKHLLDASQCKSKSGAQGTGYLCIYPGETESSKDLIAEAKFRYSTKTAKVDEIINKVAANGEVKFELKVSGDSIESIETCYGKTDDGDINESDCPSNFTTKKSSPPKVTISDLENNQSYSFKARLIDKSGTPGPWFESFELTPVPTTYPLQAYQGQGGELTCQTSSSNSLFFLSAVLFGLLALRLRRKIKLSVVTPALLLVFVCALPTKSSFAEFGQLNIGLLGSPYLPDLDNENITGSDDKIFPFYKCFFRKKLSQKTGPINPLMGVEVDMHVWDGYGSLQLGMGLGYTYVNGRALNQDAVGNPDCESPIDSAKVRLHMYQIRPQLTYLFSPYAEHVPLIPYIRGALIAHGYSFTANDKISPSFTNADGHTNKANGFRFGYQAALGLMIMLDFLEPGVMRDARGDGSINHIYLKGELSYTKIDTFGKKGFQFSAKDIMGSKLPLLWTFGLVFELP